jgi:hypothetical protein
VSRSLVLKIIWACSIVYLVVSTLSLRRDYQDSWILQGLEIPFALFLITFALAFFAEARESILILIAVVSRLTFLLIPTIKYTWYMGVFIDQSMQFSLASSVLNTHKLMTDVPIANFLQYTGVPSLHLLYASSSLFLNISIVDAIKFVSLLLSPLYCLVTYAIVKKTGLGENRQVLTFALFVSAIPLSISEFNIGGVTLGVPLLLIILFLSFSIIGIKDWRYVVLCILFFVILAASHSGTSIILASILPLALLVQHLLRSKFRVGVRSTMILLAALVGLLWMLVQAPANIQTIVNAFVVNVPQGTTPNSDYITPTFFQLFRASPLAGVGTFLIYYGATLFLLVLGLIGFVILIKTWKRSSGFLKFLTLFFSLSFVIMAFGYVIKLGPTRMLLFIVPLLPIFCAITFVHLPKKKLLFPIVISVTLLLVTVQFYGCQPMMAPANLVNPNLPANVPLGYVGTVNSIYQRQVIAFALKYLDIGRIACDENTFNQFFSVANSTFVSNHLPYYDYPIGKSEPSSYQLFIIHLPGKAGGFSELAKFRDPDSILKEIDNSSIVYSNGQSFVLLNH